MTSPETEYIQPWCLLCQGSVPGAEMLAFMWAALTKAGPGKAAG